MDRKLHVFTSAAVNYLPKVRMLCRSIRRHHPEAMIHLALADERPDWLSAENEPFDSILELSQLAIPHWRSWTFMHSIVELSTAIKPFALKRLLERDDCEAVLYFDPDMVLFSRVDDVLATLASSNVALTPHQTTPEKTFEAVLDNEVTSLRMGIFNLGFVGVRPTAEGKRFADWWAERCYLLCRAEPHNGLFTDQKWANFAPVFFDGVAILKSPRLNVATWNLTTRRFTGNLAAGFQVDGEPLGFYHFTGFDSGAHRVMAVKNAGGNTAVQELIAWYERETTPARGDPVSAWPWAFGRFSDGTPVKAHHRWLFRENRDIQLAFPDPYDAGDDRPTLVEWCQTEGRVRFPDFFAKDGGPARYAPAPGHGPIRPGVALKLALLMFAPRHGRLLRQRLVRLLRREGLAGIARRLRRNPGQGSA